MYLKIALQFLLKKKKKRVKTDNILNTDANSHQEKMLNLNKEYTNENYTKISIFHLSGKNPKVC